MDPVMSQAFLFIDLDIRGQEILGLDIRDLRAMLSVWMLNGSPQKTKSAIIQTLMHEHSSSQLPTGS